MVESTVVRIERLPPRAFLRLKSWLPPTPDGALPIPSAENIRVLSVRPGEWWLVSQRADTSLHERLSAEVLNQNFVLVDLSDSYETLIVRGAQARDLLSKGCGLDLHPSQFAVGRCARTRFSQIPVLIECVGEPYSFELTAARSYLQYLQDWLADAALEFRGVQ